MAKSKYEYVRYFERSDHLLPNTWIVVRIDGRGFRKFTTRYSFEKPNDARGLHLMSDSVVATLRNLPEIVFAYGHSDEFSFVFERAADLFERRAAKIVTTIVSTFTANYVLGFEKRFGSPLDVEALPTFDGRVVLYPTTGNLRDYLSWRQVDCHVNNTYNTTFWALVQKGGVDPKEAEEELRGTVYSDKNEILFSRFGINYNNEPEMFRKGSVIYRNYNSTSQDAVEPLPNDKIPISNSDSASTAVPPPQPSKTQAEQTRKRKRKMQIVVEHVDIIEDGFWEKRPWILNG